MSQALLSTKFEEGDIAVPKITEGKDEMNLAEFPLSAISDRLSPDQKTLTFEDRVFDVGRNEMITRQLTITASDQYGLPTAHDDEVIVGLIQLSKLLNFADRKVFFTRYQLIQVLGWRDEGKSYDRLGKSLNRWVGVTLYYKNAWRDKKNQSWADEKFHILDNVTLFDREQARESTAQQEVLPLSSFTWNDVIFNSFQAGNLKTIDFDFIKSLKSAIAKRLYRFLDKRFFHTSRWEFDLKEVSWEHIGLSRNQDSANLKRTLLPAIQELEAAGFLKPLDPLQRFYKVRSGKWKVVLEKARKAEGKPMPLGASSAQSNLLEALIQRGVMPSTAEKAIFDFPSEKIIPQLEVFDWLVARNDTKVSRNPAGFLLSSIRGDYQPPKAFKSREEENQRRAKSIARKEKQAQRDATCASIKLRKEQERERIVAEFWMSHSDEERLRLQAEALTMATPMQRNLLANDGLIADSIRKFLLDAYAINLMGQTA